MSEYHPPRRKEGHRERIKCSPLLDVEKHREFAKRVFQSWGNEEHWGTPAAKRILRKAVDDIGQIIDKNRAKTNRWLRRQVRAVKEPAAIRSIPDEAIAIGLIVTNPSLSVTSIANLLGVSRTSMYRWEKFREVWKNMRESNRSELSNYYRSGYSTTGEEGYDGNTEISHEVIDPDSLDDFDSSCSNF